MSSQPPPVTIYSTAVCPYCVAAKNFLKGSYAVNNLDSSAAIAETLVSLQEAELPRDYIDKRSELIDAVTLDQVKAIAKKLLEAEPAILIFGPAQS